MHPVRALFQRDAWANLELLRRCAELDPRLLAREAPGTYGTIPRTMTHIVGNGAFFLSLLTGGSSAAPVAPGEQWDLAALGPIAEADAGGWRTLLDGSPDPDVPIWPKEPVSPARRVVMVQYIHHADTHRSHVGTVLGAAGAEPPNLSGWRFGALDPAADGPVGPWADGLLLRFFEHLDWATGRVLEHCVGLGDAALGAGAAGTYGTVRETLTHLLDAHVGYLSRLEGTEDVELRGAAEPDVLREWAERGRTGWRAYLEAAPDHERMVPNPRRPVPAWVLTLQAIHHANDHLAHVGTILGANGLPVPEVDAWAHATRA